MSNSGAITGAPPPAATDPIAIASLIATLPELEGEFKKAMAKAEEANKALDVIQNRIDVALKTLREKAPRGSMWNSRKQEMTAKEVIIAQMNQALKAGPGNQSLFASCATPGGIQPWSQD